MARHINVISSRRIYFLSGFDPRGASFYHRLYLEQAQKQARISGKNFTVGPRIRTNHLVNEWKVESGYPELPTVAEYKFLCWDDIVRDAWQSGHWRLAAKAPALYFKHLKQGLSRKFKLAGRGPFYSYLLPLAYILFILAILCALILGTIAITGDLISTASIAALCLLLAGSALYGLAQLGRKLGVWWILRTYRFLTLWGETNPDNLQKRILNFADIVISDQKTHPVDEVLIIGHCVGTIVATSVMAKITENLAPQAKHPYTLITLGQCIPYMSHSPLATHIHRDLKTMTGPSAAPWIDISAKSDALCFHDTGPVADLPGSKPPRRFIMRPYKMFAARDYRRMKFNKMRLHFQYLMASDILTDYDYFHLTAGPQSAREYLLKKSNP